MAKYDSRRYGETSREKADTQALKESWATADRMTAELPEGTPWQWVPRGTVYIDESILPRDGGVDPTIVREYAMVWHDLPPVRVQRGTYRLIDGAHRINAAFETTAGTDHVKIVEEDAADEDLILLAYEANVSHGRPLTLKERQKYVRILLDRFPNSPIAELARKANVDPVTVARYREASGEVPETVTYQRGEQTVTRRASSPGSGRAKGDRKPLVFASPVKRTPDPSYETNEPAALAGLRAIASIRNAQQWLQSNAQFGDEVREYLQPARKILAEMADVLDGVPV